MTSHYFPHYTSHYKANEFRKSAHTKLTLNIPGIYIIIIQFDTQYTSWKTQFSSLITIYPILVYFYSEKP